MAFLPGAPLPSRRASVTDSVSRRAARSAVAPPARAARRTRMLVIDAGSKDDIDKILNAAGGSLVVIDYSTSWCGPCKIIAPFFEELSDRFPDVVFVKVMGDADNEASELMKREGIRAVPAFHFWKSSERVKDFTGARKEELESAVVSLK